MRVWVVEVNLCGELTVKLRSTKEKAEELAQEYLLSINEDEGWDMQRVGAGNYWQYINEWGNNHVCFYQEEVE